MYVKPNFTTKKALKAAVTASELPVYTYSPGPFPRPVNGRVSVEGPHFPKPHKWYAVVEVIDGRVVKVVV